MFRRKFLMAAIVAGIAALAGPATSQAGFQVTLYAPGGGPVTIVDGGAGDADATANNIILVASQVVGTYTFTFELATTNTSGTPTLAFVTSSVGLVSGTGAGTLAVVVSASGFTQPVSPPDIQAVSGATFQAQPGNTSSYTVSYAAALDNSNTLSTTVVGTVIGSGGPQVISATGNANQNDTQNIGSVTGPYTINFGLTAIAGGAGPNQIDLDGSVQLRPVPAPAGLILAATALPFFGLLRRRLRRPEATTVA